MIRHFLLWVGFCFTLSGVAFDAGEHALLGNMAMQKYHSEFDNRIINLEANIDFSYGHLIAMSADMYKSVEELALDEQKYIKNYLLRNREKLKECIDLEVQSILSGKEYEKCSETSLIKRKFRYLTLAHDNYEHFAWHNLKSYIAYHEKALWFAQLAHLKCDDADWKNSNGMCEAKKSKMVELIRNSEYDKKLPKQYKWFSKVLARRKLTQNYLIELPKTKMIHLALFTNAYADHFLSDAFSAGHLRIPRSQIDAFVENSEKLDELDNLETREEGSAVSGALTQFLHNLDGDLKGIKVINARGDEFVVRGDKQLFAQNGTRALDDESLNSDRTTLPVEAIGLSLNEVFQTIEQGQSSTSSLVYQALYLVPYVDYRHERTLHDMVQEHLAQSSSVKEALNSMSPEMKNIYRSFMLFEESNYKSYFLNFANHLDSLMQLFRGQVKDEMTQMELIARLPTKLSDALLNVR